MTSRSFSRLSQAFWTAVFVGSLTACSSVKLTHTDPNGHSVTKPAASSAATTPAPVADPAPIAPSDSAGPNAKAKPDATAAAAPAKSSALDSQISGLRQQVTARKEYNEALRNYVDGKEKQLATILASDRAGGPSAQEFDLRTSIKSKIAEIDRESPAWQQKIDAHKTVLSKAGDDPHSSDLQAQINALSEQRAELLRQREKLAALPDKLKTVPEIQKQ